MDAKLINQLNALLEKNVDVALVTVVSKLGSSPRDSGSMMIVDATGNLVAGTIGGGKVEETAKRDAAMCIKNACSSSFEYELTQKDIPEALGMVCGGRMSVFVKVFNASDDLIIFGGGHIGIELYQLAQALGYSISIVDHRLDYANRDRFPNAKCVMLMDDFKAEPLEITPTTSVVIVTHGHTYDLEALSEVVNSNARYIGVIGSKNKLNYCFEELQKNGVSEEKLRKLYAPIGLDLGGETPVEIALAILAEIQAVKYNKSGRFLREVKGR